MKLLVIENHEAGQRLDKYLGRYLAQAPKSFLYKMMRKKNITLNGKKCEGSEKLVAGDEVKLFFADDTLEKFAGKGLDEVAGSKSEVMMTTEREKTSEKKMTSQSRRMGNEPQGGNRSKRTGTEKIPFERCYRNYK